MEYKSKSDIKDIILDVLRKGFERRAGKNPSKAASALGPDVSLVRNVHVPSIISFNCVLILYYFSM